MSLDVLNEYSAVTNVQELKEYSAKPLRKCIRVNTLLKTVPEFIQYAKSKSWQLTPVEWCEEGFYVYRDSPLEPLGKDPWHQLGYFYMQEASSMLPVAVLQPSAGELVLDMSAAPGSKTTQMSALMGNQGVIVANDVQPKRLKTLQAATYRLGATNVVLSQKRGQWFAEHMCERFNKVLCDAPCSAQGTVRKDKQALEFFRQESVQAMAKVQRELLDAAIAATKVGGTIVYSTCTLTYEENELIVEQMVQKYGDAITVVHPQTVFSNSWNMEPGVANAAKVQEVLRIPERPMLRLWPQTYDSEGFFVAVLQKNGATHTGKRVDAKPRREQLLHKKTLQELTASVTAQFGTDFLDEHEVLFEHEGSIYFANDEVGSVHVPFKNYSLGIPYGKLLKNKTIRISQEIAKLRGNRAKTNVIALKNEQYSELIANKNSICNPTISGDVVVQYNGSSLGVCKALQGVLKNNLPAFTL